MRGGDRVQITKTAPHVSETVVGMHEWSISAAEGCHRQLLSPIATVCGWFPLFLMQPIKLAISKQSYGK